ncbi:hypothetical protein ASZ90_009143 [hydrocarbon metagenome]|uniref:Uncharacterized protein n=1 Tax=hydrocarbon metagenome TaxID=938273 RepID=A0A0W8FJN4_9ZZZZ
MPIRHKCTAVSYTRDAFPDLSGGKCWETMSTRFIRTPPAQVHAQLFSGRQPS